MIDSAYFKLATKVIREGHAIEGRNGPMRALFGESLKIDLRDGFPLLTSKYVSFKHIVVETLWYLLGTDRIDFLKNHNVNIWDKWAKDGSIGKTYGYQWRNYNSEGYDQIKDVLEELDKPGSRRALINGWNPLQLREMRLPPCIVLMQFFKDDDGYLHMVVYQRSADIMVGVPYDIAEMALLQSIIANIKGLKPATLTFQYGNLHIYEEHVQTFIRKQLTSEVIKAKPKLEITRRLRSIDGLRIEDFKINGYNGTKKIKYEVFE